MKFTVTPAKAGAQPPQRFVFSRGWAPAFAGVTDGATGVCA